MKLPYKIILKGINVIPLIGIALSLTQPAMALRNIDMSGNDNGAAAVYEFNESDCGGDSQPACSAINDSAGNGSPLNLKTSTAGNLVGSIKTNAIIMGGKLVINPKPNTLSNADDGYTAAQKHRTYLTSGDETAATVVDATKLTSSTCYNNGFTIQAFVRPWFPFQGQETRGNLIVGLSSNSLTGASNDNNISFGIFQTGRAGTETAALKIRSSAGMSQTISSVPKLFNSVRESENISAMNEIIATVESNGAATLYVNRVPSAQIMTTRNFLANSELVIGNDRVQVTADGSGNVDTQNQRNWSGEIFHVAIYCRGFSRADVLGDAQEGLNRLAAVVPSSTPITATKIEARKIYQRLTGILTPIDSPIISQMADLLAQGKRTQATRLVVGDNVANLKSQPDFLNVAVKNMALKMSNREETIRVKLNDFAASIIGVTRDETDARELLYGDFYYMANPTKAAVPNNLVNDLLKSNNHYEVLDNGQWDIGEVLMRVNGQKLLIDPNTGATSPHPDPAGVITSRAFMSAHSIAGTNRRLVEYSLRQFLCTPISTAADTSGSPARIGRDIDRTPGGDGTKFESSCKGCHVIMDGFRGAFGRFDYDDTNKIVKHTELNYPSGVAFNNNANCTNATANSKSSDNIICKMVHNFTTFPQGYKITDNSFVNYATTQKNKTYFGWRGSYAKGGIGANQFGHMVADSKRFSQCMAKRVYESVCIPGEKYEYNSVAPKLNEVADRFESNGYKLKYLFQEIAALNGCVK